MCAPVSLRDSMLGTTQLCPSVQVGVPTHGANELRCCRNPARRRTGVEGSRHGQQIAAAKAGETRWSAPSNPPARAADAPFMVKSVSIP